MRTKRSVPIMSLKEQVGAPQPMVAFRPDDDAAWHRRAQLSTLALPAMRASFWIE